MKSCARRLHSPNSCTCFQVAARGAHVRGFHFPKAPRHGFLQFRRCAAANQFAVVHEADAAAAFGFVQICSGDHQSHAAADQFLKDQPEVSARYGVHSVGGFVQQQDGGLMKEGAHQCQFLFHATGELAGMAIAKGLHASHAEEPQF